MNLISINWTEWFITWKSEKALASEWILLNSVLIDLVVKYFAVWKNMKWQHNDDGQIIEHRHSFLWYIINYFKGYTDSPFFFLFSLEKVNQRWSNVYLRWKYEFQ